MSDFKIACEAKALAVFIPSPPPVIKYKPYFHVDFSKKHILSLIQDFPIRGIRSAGICLINMPFSSHEQTLMAFRVQWKEGDLVRNADPNIDAIVPVDFPIPEQGIVPFITVTSVEGDAVWVQAKDGDFLTVPRFGFVFFDTETLKKLVEIPGCTHLRFRRTIIRSKLKLPPNPASESAKGFFLTLTVEPVPTWEDKVYGQPAALAVAENELTSEDAIAYDYGYPCPPAWIPDLNAQNNILGYGIIKRSQKIKVANGVAITMGSLTDAVFKNPTARNLLKEWKLFPNAQKLHVIADGKKIDVI